MSIRLYDVNYVCDIFYRNYYYLWFNIKCHAVIFLMLMKTIKYFSPFDEIASVHILFALFYSWNRLKLFDQETRYYYHFYYRI